VFIQFFPSASGVATDKFVNMDGVFSLPPVFSSLKLSDIYPTRQMPIRIGFWVFQLIELKLVTMKLSCISFEIT